MPPPSPVLLLLLAALCGGVVAPPPPPGEVDFGEADTGGWIPIVASRDQRAPSSASEPQFGSRILKPRLPRQGSIITTTVAPLTTLGHNVTTPQPTSRPQSTSKLTKTTRITQISSTKPTRAPSERARPTRQGTTSPAPRPAPDDDEDTKTLAQQVADGKYGLIQNELFDTAPSRPGILSYESNNEVPRDTADNLGGLKPDEVWLAEGHVLVLSGGPLGAKGNWPPIDNYQAPPRQVKLPPNPSVPPPFPVQLKDGGPTGFITPNGTNPFLYGPPGNYETGNGIFPSAPPPPPFPQNNNGSRFPLVPPPPQGLFRQENLTLDDDDPSIFYPPPYDFSFHQDKDDTDVPPGPLVPGIVLPPPPGFFAPLNHSAAPALFVPEDIHQNQVDHEAYLPQTIPGGVPQHHGITEAPPSENEIYVQPGYPLKEPKVYIHHQGSPVQIQFKNFTTQVSAPEKLLVYELPSLPSRDRVPGHTVVSSTPSPTALYYTLPQDPSPVKFTIYTATPAPEEPTKRPEYFFSTSKPQQFHLPHRSQPPRRPNYYPPPAPYYNSVTTSTPKPVFLYPDTTPAVPKYVLTTTTTPPPVYNSPVPNEVSTTTASPLYFQPHRANLNGYPSKIRFPDESTPNPFYYNRNPAPGAYIPNDQNNFFYPTPPPAIIPSSTPAPQYLPQPPTTVAPNSYYYPIAQRRPPQTYYNPRPDNGYYYPPIQQQRPLSPTASPAFDAYYYQTPNRQSSNNFNYFPPRKPQLGTFVSTTANPLISGLYTPQDEKYLDDITKGYFTLFGQKITTPLPPLAHPTEVIPTPVSLHDDTRINYRRPLPPINPDSEFIDLPPPRGGPSSAGVVTYQLPGQGQRGPSHYYFLTPRGLRVSEQGQRTPRRSSSSSSSASLAQHGARQQQQQVSQRHTPRRQVSSGGGGGGAEARSKK